MPLISNVLTHVSMSIYRKHAVYLYGNINSNINTNRSQKLFWKKKYFGTFLCIYVLFAGNRNHYEVRNVNLDVVGVKRLNAFIITINQVTELSKRIHFQLESFIERNLVMYYFGDLGQNPHFWSSGLLMLYTLFWSLRAMRYQ